MTMKQQPLTTKMQRQRKFMLVLPIILLPFLTLFFWALGGGKVDNVNAQANVIKGFNSQLPDAKLKDNSALNKMSYYEKAALDSDKLRQQMKSDPYYHPHSDTDTAALHFPKSKALLLGGDLQASKLIGSSDDASANAAQVYKKLAALQTAINKPATSRDNSAKFNSTNPISPSVASPLKNQASTEDPELKQMNGLLEKILDIQHPERVKAAAEKTGNTVPVKKFRAIPAIIDGTQKIVQGTVIRLKLTDTVTLGGQLYNKGQLIFGSGNLANQRYTLNIKSIHVGYNFYPVDLTVFDQTDGLEGISVPEAVTGDALRDGATSGVQNMDIMSFDPSMTAQLTTAGINTAKGLFGKKVKRVKGKIKDGHTLLLRDNLEAKNSR